MTLDDVMADAARQLDGFLEQRLRTLEAEIRRDLLLTGPEDEDALDRPPDPDSPWRRATVEEVLELERAALEAWRTETLAALRRELSACTTDALPGQKRGQ